MNFKQLLNEIPEVKKTDILNGKMRIEDIENIHHTLTLENPLTYIIYMHHEKSLTIKERNDIYRIIDRLKKNNKNTYEASIEKHGLKEAVIEDELELSDSEDEHLEKKVKQVTI